MTHPLVHVMSVSWALTVSGPVLGVGPCPRPRCLGSGPCSAADQLPDPFCNVGTEVESVL